VSFAEGWLGDFLVWATLLQWLAIAAVFFRDSIRVHMRTRRQYRTALEVGNGRVMVARIRNDISRWYILASAIALAVGLLAVYSYVFLPHPPPDTRLAGVVIREGIVVLLFAVWRTKRGNVVLYRMADAYRDSVAVLGEVAHDTNVTSHDTNVRVREMQNRGQSDQPLEQTDRFEGHEHRVDITDKIDADREERADERRLDREERAEERANDREERRDERGS
jgi:hypothetical protein